MRAAADRALLVAGLAMAGAGFAHAFAGWPPLARELARLGAGADTTGPLAVGWLFGSGAMVACGSVVLLGRADLRHGGRLGAAVCRVVGGLYLAFGLGATAYRWPNPHFLAFVVLGGLVLASAHISSRR